MASICSVLSHVLFRRLPGRPEENPESLRIFVVMTKFRAQNLAKKSDRFECLLVISSLLWSNVAAVTLTESSLSYFAAFGSSTLSSVSYFAAARTVTESSPN
jgi:hypothetical protein